MLEEYDRHWRNRHGGEEEIVTRAIDIILANTTYVKSSILRWPHFGDDHEDRLMRLLLLGCVDPTPHSIFADVPDRKVERALETATTQAEWNRNRPSYHTGLIGE